MFGVVMLPHAKEDIREAAKWYNNKQKGLGRRFTSEVRKKVALVRQNPEAYVLRYDSVHTALLDFFPFMIHYTIDYEIKLIIVASVLHTSRDPDIWKER
jgi:plasmid stabilization system protein ParE